jgi:hypothetical protein
MKFDFGSPENTAQLISDNTNSLVDELYKDGCELAEAQEAVRNQTAKRSVHLRESLGKVTEGTVQAMLDSNEELGLLRRKAERLVVKMSCLRQSLEAAHDDRKLFCAWMESQRAAGLQG